jgi:NADH:ubiquinone oxidoreductase subunit E
MCGQTYAAESVPVQVTDSRHDAVEAICAKTGKTPEQAEAFLAILGSAFRRRGWVDGEPLSEQEIGKQVGTFLEARRG